MIVGVLAISPEIVKNIGSKEYWDGTHIIMWVVFATFLNYTYTLYVNIEFFHRKTALISSGTVLTAFINVVLNYMFLEMFLIRIALGIVIDAVLAVIIVMIISGLGR